LAKKEQKKKVTLSIDSSIYDSFRDHCEENAIMLSRKIEIWMEQELEKNRSKNKKNEKK